MRRQIINMQPRQRCGQTGSHANQLVRLCQLPLLKQTEPVTASCHFLSGIFRRSFFFPPAPTLVPSANLRSLSLCLFIPPSALSRHNRRGVLTHTRDSCQKHFPHRGSLQPAGTVSAKRLGSSALCAGERVRQQIHARAACEGKLQALCMLLY